MIHLLAIGSYVATHVHSILLAIVASYVVGFTWHGPLFGKQWMAWNGIKPPKKEDMKFSMMLPGLTANFIAVFVQAAVMGRAFQILVMPSIVFALIIATILWLPFTAMTICNTYAWLGKPVKLMVLDAAYYLVSFYVIAAVLYVTM